MKKKKLNTLTFERNKKQQQQNKDIAHSNQPYLACLIPSGGYKNEASVGLL